MLRTSPQDWRNFLAIARSVIAHIDNTTVMRRRDRTTEQTWLVGGLQRLALVDSGSGEVVDISDWCSRQWMSILQIEPQNVEALRGLGRAWLARAQPALTRIHRLDGASSSSEGSSQWSAPSMTTSDDERQSAAAKAEAERRSGTADYVEARGSLQPAIDYLERALAAATAQRSLSGEMLATTAEAYMSLGNVSSPRINQTHFARALQLLRAAAAIQGYTLSRYLQQYVDMSRVCKFLANERRFLDDYGRLLD
ncbi:hypothetical protein LTR78_004324 [Recurvomyces mirabilis]|uniref:Uncharacterized protein n=1 Tax=Recurvomyces mirabilis TaxID=574656 RepID=A0AAE1C2G2_9PEZI|nr:hypothetical protein LTR78_004324 [Recurvomyces mirabilis]